VNERDCPVKNSYRSIVRTPVKKSCEHSFQSEASFETPYLMSISNKILKHSLLFVHDCWESRAYINEQKVDCAALK